MLGVVCTGIAFAIFYELVATIGPGRAYTVTYIAPGFAVVYGAILLDERITVATIAGLALILAGSYLAAGGVAACAAAGAREETRSRRRTPFVESRTTDPRRVYA